MAHTTSLTQANDDDEIIELTDIVEKGTVPLVSDQEFSSLESQMADLLSNDDQEVDNLDELDLDALLGTSGNSEKDFPDDMFDGLDAKDSDSLDNLLAETAPKMSTPAAKAFDRAGATDNDVANGLDFDSLLQDMVDTPSSSDRADRGRLDKISDSGVADEGADSSEDTMDDNFLGSLDEVDNLLRDLVPPAQPASLADHASSKTAEVEENDLASLLADLDKTPASADKTGEVDDLDALLDSIMNPFDLEDPNLAASKVPAVTQAVDPQAPAGFDDLDALLGAALQPVLPHAEPVAPSKPNPASEHADEPAALPVLSNTKNDDDALDALLAQSAAVNLSGDDGLDALDALLNDATQILPPTAPAPQKLSAGDVANTGDASDFDLDALLNEMKASSLAQNASGNMPADGEKDEALNLDLDSILTDDTDAQAEELLKGIFATEETANNGHDDTLDAENTTANGADIIDDFDLDTFLAGLDTADENFGAALHAGATIQESPEAVAAYEAEQDLKMQEITLAALSEELGENSAEFSLDTALDGRESNSADEEYAEQTNSRESISSGVLLDEPELDRPTHSISDVNAPDSLSDIDFDAFPLDNDLGDPLLISEDSPHAELGEAVLQGLDLLATDIAAIQAQLANLAPLESQQGLMGALQGNFAQLQEDVQQLSERQAMSMAAVEARISDMEAQFAEKFAVNSDSALDIVVEQLAFLSTRLDSLESLPDTTQADNEQAGMINDVAKLVDRVDALELHRLETHDATADNVAVSALEERIKTLESNTERAVAEAAARIIREEIAGLLAELSDSSS